MDTKKNNSFAKKYRNAGNDYFRKEKHFEALMLYNRSLCVAEKGSESIPINYGNRSAIYIKLNQFDLCLENIQLARKFNYPAEKIEKLNKREERCIEMMKDALKPSPDDNPFNYFKLSYPASTKLPQIVDCLELRNNKKFGNYVVTTRELKTGDIIAIEEPTYKSPNSSARLHRCGYCFKDQLMNLFPCSGCAMAMFCSEKCQKQAVKEFHQFECNVTANPKIAIDYPLRMVVKCLSIFDYDATELQKFLERNDKPVSVFDFDFSNPEDEMYEKNMILVSLSIQNTALYLKMGKKVIAAQTKDFVNFHPKLKELWRKHGSFLNGLLEKSLVALSSMSHVSAWFSRDVNLSATSMKEDMIRSLNLKTGRTNMHQENVGQGLYPFVTSLNGSCNRNTSLVCVSNKIVTYVCSPIPAGGQLFRVYSEPFYNFGPAAQRQAQIQQMFGYWCDCDACKKKWPTYEALKGVDPFFQYDYAQSFLPHEKAKEAVARNNAYVDQHYKENNPTQEVYITIDNNNFELIGIARPQFYP